jgi:uncharacterized spore protein YtfJ
MSTPVPLQPIAQLFENSLSIRHVYGEAVRHGDTTVIPVAKVAFGFGAGMGRRPRAGQVDQAGAAGKDDSAAQGSGGGGGARITPVGALEIGPRGTRFIAFGQLPRLLGALTIGLGAGLLLARRDR